MPEDSACPPHLPEQHKPRGSTNGVSIRVGQGHEHLASFASGYLSRRELQWEICILAVGQHVACMHWTGVEILTLSSELKQG